MGLDDRAADRQPHAHPVGFGGVEGLERSVEFLRFEPRTGVLHFDDYVVRIVYTGDDRKLAWAIAGISHRFDGVDNQIDHYLLQLDPIRRDEGQIVGEPVLQSDGIALRLGLGQGDDFANSPVDVQEFSARRHFFDQGANAADHLAGASAVPDDTTERLSDFVHVRLLCAEPTHGWMVAVILTSATARSVRARHSGGVRSVRCRRPEARSSRSYPSMWRNASLASRI